MKGVLLDKATLGEGVNLSVLAEQFEKFEVYDSSPESTIHERIAGMDVVLSNKVYISASHMDSNPSLRFIGILATGTNNVDLVAARAKGIAVSNVVHYCSTSVAQHTLALILSLCHGVVDFQNDIREGLWQKHGTFCLFTQEIIQLKNKTLGILGYGALGQEVAKMASALGMKIKVVQSLTGEQKPNRYPLDDVLASCDIFTIHCPLTKETDGLINLDKIRLMKPSAFLINTARGGIIQESCLKIALQENIIKGAALDVLTQEPPPKDHPLLQERIPGLVITPHMAWASVEARQQLIDNCIANIQGFKNGKPINVVC